MAEQAFDVNSLSEEQRKILLGQLQGGQEMPQMFDQQDRGFLGNIMQRKILNPLQVRLGLKDSPQDILRQQQSILNQYELQGMRQDRQRDKSSREELQNLLISQGMDPGLIGSLSLEELENIAVNRMDEPVTNNGITTQTNPLTRAQTKISELPTSIQEYEYGRNQIAPPMRAPTYFERQDKNKVTKQSKPSAVQTYEYLMELNPEIANLSAQEKQDLLFKIIRQDPDTAAQIAKREQMASDGGLFLTPAERSVDDVFGKDFSAYNALGGATTGRKNMRELTEIISILSAPRNQQTITGRAVALMPDITRPDLTLDVQNRVERIITEDLRATLGAQFTENEARQFIQRSFNIALPESVNADRLRRLRAGMSQAHKAREDAGKYFLKNGTVKGFDNFKDIASFETSMYQIEDYRSFTNEEIDEMLQQGISEQTPISRAEYDILLKVAESRGL